ncbi:pre-toxin TG domain-containing protein [Bacillus nitratireducens]|uniref:pre-toxin TG domain-containing protein n=1 Tax=Bacillus nitratireducens TaxID=2026193 RepID=UPI002E1FD2B4|nr:pre-toxin TG domain-containing protein [Bacillus nitratireducens]
MSLNMYLGEVHTQTQSMNAVCTATIQGMEQAIQSIDAFAIDTVLQGQTYSSAKLFFVQTFRPLAQGIIYLCEELILQNDAFPSQFQSQVASTDVIEQEILEQIREIDRMKASMEAISQAMPIPGMDAMANLFISMRRKLQEKLDHLYEFNQTSSNNYSTAIQLATSIATGLTEVQSGKGFSPVSGTFSTHVLNMEWTTSIQAITEDRNRQADNLIEEGAMCGKPSSEEKGFDGKKLARDITGEISGEYDIRRAWDGIDPSTGEKLSTWERVFAGGMAVAGLTPFGKGIKVAKGVKMTANATKAVNKAKKVSVGKVDGAKGTGEVNKKASGTSAGEENVTYRRVQGGDSKELILVNDDGTLSLNRKWKADHNLNVSTGKDHSTYFKNKRSDSYIVEFEVPQYLDNLIRENAISQKGYKTNPLNQGRTAPKIVDKGVFDKYGFEGVAYELPDPISRWLVEYGHNAKLIK